MTVQQKYSQEKIGSLSDRIIRVQVGNQIGLPIEQLLVDVTNSLAEEFRPENISQLKQH
jgi:hypothetical protein